MPITLNGSGTVSGISAGGLPDGIVQSADLATGVGGKVLQVKQAQITATASTTSTGFSDMPLVVTMTPTSSTSKILCMVDMKISGSGSGPFFKLTKVVGGTYYNLAYGTSSTYDGFGGEHFSNSYSNYYSTPTMTISSLDTVTSTAEHSYRVQWRMVASGTAYLNRTGYSTTAAHYAYSGCSNITLMEIAT